MKQLRRLFIGLIAGALLATAGTSFGAAAFEKVAAILRPDFTLIIDGSKAELKNAPLVYNGTSYLPLRESAELFGKNVDFKNGTITLNTKEVTEMNYDDINLDEWISTHDLQKRDNFSYKVGLKDGDQPSSDKREVTVTLGSRVERFTIPSVIVGKLLVTNDNGVKLFFNSGGPYLEKVFIGSNLD